MRLWSIHPSCLDPAGLVALWREALLAQAVLAGRTRGYRFHPQLERFKAEPDPLAAIVAYLLAVHAEAEARGYSFDASRIGSRGGVPPIIPVPRGQVEYEWGLFRGKVEARNPASYGRISGLAFPPLHPLFRLVEGGIAGWERPKPIGATGRRRERGPRR